MTGLIKAISVEVTEQQRCTLPARAVPAIVIDPAPSRIAEIEMALTQANSKLAAAEKSAAAREQRAFERGQEKGLAAGQENAQSRNDEQLQELQKATGTALEAFKLSLHGEAPQLAIDLALAALERIIGDASNYRRLVAQTVQHHLKTITQQSSISVEVASVDFPDDNAIADAFGHIYTGESVHVVAMPGLSSGSCVIRLLLGRLDLGLPLQHSRVSSALLPLREKN